MCKLEKIEEGSITSPHGFLSSGVICGLKTNNTLDMGLIYSTEENSIASACFTSNIVTAAPVNICKNKLLHNKKCRAVIVNSGNANACTGKIGETDAKKMISLTAEKLLVNSDEILIASTGRIGVNLPMDKISSGIETAVKQLSETGGHDTAKSIMTTDTVPKEIAIKFKLDEKTVTIAGTAKGSGMIAPNLTAPHATMLSFITTDAEISQNFLQDSLITAVNESFNRITVDGDMSTNDSVFIIANGKADNKIISFNSPGSDIFQKALNKVLIFLAKAIAIDGEGSTKLVKVIIKNANNEKDAKDCSTAISNSLLCKTAWFGCDPNWGRILAAAGYSGATFNPNLIDLYYDDVQVVSNGEDSGKSEKELIEIMQKEQFSITVDLKAGEDSYHMWTSDISYEYVKINADYHT
ncbi:MAG TPA: bifunctional glutamate N-acetyltransferase/amino-acid acetyltransferase ArgJ [Victivallales bacterium]|nr:bifunctional glutamate N-acetyltransferase/amino-acid acetyltransferase ArgJ [Victivallales bacterium]